MSSSSGETRRLPDYHVAAMNEHGRNARIGGAWVNEDESISIKLDQFIHLNNDDGQLQIRLFPRKERT